MLVSQSPLVPQNRIIMHIDMNSFFASVEQCANPFIRGKPIGVGSKNYENTALVAISYEAKRMGVPKLCRLIEARRICPEILVIPFDPIKYYFVNRQIAHILRQYTPLVEIYSIDEAFMDLTDVMHLYPGKTPRELAQEIKDRIIDEVGQCLTSNVGIAPNKLLAKVASNWKKPNGLTEISWENRLEYLDKVPLEGIWGIGRNSAPKFAQLGITSTKQLREMSATDMRALVGGYYTRLQLLANGEHYDPVQPERSAKPHKTMQHAHTMSEPTNDKDELKILIKKLSEKLARRLRKHDQLASVVTLGFKPEKQKEYGWGSATMFYDVERLDHPTANGQEIYEAACQIMDEFDIRQTKIRLAFVGVGDLSQVNQLMFEMFLDQKTMKLDSALDEINDQYGAFKIRTADILNQKAKESELSVDREDMVFHPVSQ